MNYREVKCSGPDGRLPEKDGVYIVRIHGQWMDKKYRTDTMWFREVEKWLEPYTPSPLTREKIVEVLDEIQLDLIFMESSCDVRRADIAYESIKDRITELLQLQPEPGQNAGMSAREYIRSKSPNEKVGIRRTLKDKGMLNIVAILMEEYAKFYHSKQTKPEATEEDAEKCDHQWQEVWKDHNHQSSWGTNRCMKCGKEDNWQYDSSIERQS